MCYKPVEPFAIGQAFAFAPTYEPVTRLDPDSHRELMNRVFCAALPFDRDIRRLPRDKAMAVTHAVDLRDFLPPLPWSIVSYDVFEPEAWITHAAFLLSC